MQNCWHNTADSLENRYFKATPDPCPGSLDWALLDLIVSDLAERIKKSLQPFDAEGFLSRKKGKLRSRYLNAYNKMVRNGIDLSKNSDISAFVKLERYFEEGKSPRMIMGRNPMFNILYAQIIEPIEKSFFSLEQVANACDYTSCGEKFTKLVGEWFMENDMSKYESSQRLFVLYFEHLVYSLSMPGHTELIDTLFSYKTRKKGHTSTGVKFDFWECRGSGDMDTSLGNGILNYISTQYFLVKNYCPGCALTNCSAPGCRSYKFVVKGDDSYAAIPRFRDFYVNTYQYFGFDAKIFVRKSAEDVEFCSGHFIEYQPGKYTYVQKIKKLLESLTTCLNQDAIDRGWVMHYYKSLGLMYKRLYAGVPYYEDIADFLCRTNVKHGLNTNLTTSYNLHEAFNNFSTQISQPDISLVTVSIAMVNKMDIAELETLKAWLRISSLDFGPEQSKRCNTKTAKESPCQVLNFDNLNADVLDQSLPKEIHRYRTLYRKNRSNFLRRMG